MFDNIKADLAAALEKDPAAKSKFEIFLTYGGFRALCAYRRAHWFYTRGLHTIAFLISAHARKNYGIEIHPAAKIGKGIFIFREYNTGNITTPCVILYVCWKCV